MEVKQKTLFSPVRLKQCSKCKEWKEESLKFFNRSINSKYYGRYCKECGIKYRREYTQRAINKEHRKEYRREYTQRPHVKEKARIYDKKRRKTEKYKKRMTEWNRQRILKKYGMTIEDKEKMFEEQEGKCSICQKTFDGLWGSFNCQIDHDHKTGRVRSLLCNRCNLDLNKDDIMAMKNKIRYIEKHQILDLMGVKGKKGKVSK